MSVRFETQTVAAEVQLAEGQAIKGSIYLQRSPVHMGLETPLEMLNRPEPFFAVSLATNEIVLVPKSQVAYISCDASVQADSFERHQAAKILKLHVIMVGGSELRGSTAAELPSSHARVLDFLNIPEPFFALETDDAITFIHRPQIRFVSPLD